MLIDCRSAVGDLRETFGSTRYFPLGFNLMFIFPALKLRMEILVMLLVVAPTPLAQDVEGRLESRLAPPRVERRSWALLMVMMMNNNVFVW